jgi:NAD(P)-dependent dehydrogenase (short-subunit alcohol dehydrogenase family)
MDRGNRPAMGKPPQQQEPPGTEAELDPPADHGEDSYHGQGRLEGRAAIITGADSGIGRAVAIAFAREGADVLISYLSEDEDARETGRLVEEAGRKAVLVPGDIRDAAHCRSIVERAIDEFGHLEVLVNNAAFQMTRDSLLDVPDEEWDRTFDTNVRAMFHLCKAAIPHMREGAAIVNSTSINYDQPNPTLIAYAATKAAIANFTASLAQILGPKGIRVNAVAPGPIWTPLIPSTMDEEAVESFGDNVPLERAGQPAELAPAYVLLASDDGSYMTGAVVPVTGGKPIL